MLNGREAAAPTIAEYLRNCLQASAMSFLVSEEKNE